MRLNGKIAVITGASKGIGKVIAQTYSKEGAKVILTARSEQELKTTCESITSIGGKADYSVVDISKKEQVKKMVDTVMDKYGPIDICLMHN